MKKDNSVAKTVLAVLSGLGWGMAAVGVFLAYKGLADGAGLALTATGAAVIVGGLVQVAMAQLAGATLQTADNTAELVALQTRQIEAIRALTAALSPRTEGASPAAPSRMSLPGMRR